MIPLKKIFFVLFFVAPRFCTGQLITNQYIIENFYSSCKSGFITFHSIQSGIDLVNLEQYQRGINHFNRAIDIDSNSCDAYYLLAFCYQQKNELKKSLDMANKSISINRNNPSAWVIKAYSELYSKDTIASLLSFDSAIKVAPKIVDGYFGTAKIYYAQKKYEPGTNLLMAFEKNNANQLSKIDVKKFNLLFGKLLFRTENQRASLTHLKNSRINGDAEANYILGICYLRTELNKKKAKKYISKARKLGYDVQKEILEEIK